MRIHSVSAHHGRGHVATHAHAHARTLAQPRMAFGSHHRNHQGRERHVLGNPALKASVMRANVTNAVGSVLFPWLSRRAALIIAAAGFSAVPSVPLLGARAAANAAAPSLLQTFDVKSPELDPLKYRGLLLPNGLRVLLGSNANARTASAALTVQVGSMTDPESYPGLAHFCEHMLFLGTEKFPDESDFERYVANAGGSNNAFTADEQTCYYFVVDGEALDGSLMRFADFFVAPLFTASATQREVMAIDSEHAKNLQSDLWRLDQLQKTLADQQHPYAKFFTGNKKTLRNGEPGAREALISFFDRYYRADAMTLALVGPQPVDALQAMAIKYFSSLPSGGLPLAHTAYDSLPLPFPSWAKRQQAPQLTLATPVDERRALTLLWCLPVRDWEAWALTKPELIWRRVVENRAEGSLLSALKRQGFVNSVQASVSTQTRTFSILEAQIDLSQTGYKRWRDVVQLFFGYLRLVSEQGVPSHVFQDAAAIADLELRFDEAHQPLDLAVGASPDMDLYPPELWIEGPSRIYPGGEDDVRRMLEHTSQPANAFITLIGKSAISDFGKRESVEPIYSTKYARTDIQSEVRAWERAPLPTQLSPPPKNRFIPTNLALKCDDIKNLPLSTSPLQPARVSPTLLRDEPGLRLHFVQDCFYRRPKAFAFFSLYTPEFTTDALTYTAAELYQALFGEALQEITYDAGLAGLSAGVAGDYRGLTLSVSGFDERLPELLRLVSSRIRNFPIEKLAFERRRDALVDRLSFFQRKKPVSLCTYYRSLALETPVFTAEQLLTSAKALTIETVQSFQKQLLPAFNIEGLICGNVDAAAAEAMLNVISETLAPSPLPADKMPKRYVRQLPLGEIARQQFEVKNEAEENSATEVYFQVGMDEGSRWALLALFDQIISQPFFAELRTKQQLGYIVNSAVVESRGVRGLVLQVQSNVLPPPEVERKIMEFVADVRRTIADLPQKELRANLDSLASRVLDVDKRLASQSGRFWGEISQQRYDYERPWRVADKVKALTRAELLAFYDELFSPQSVARRVLVTHVFAPSAKPKAFETVQLPDTFFPQPKDGLAEKVLKTA